MPTLDDLDTPFVAVDLDRVDANVATLQALCDEHGLDNRPHVKTHKLPLLAHKQIQAGAVGITAQKLSEAEVMILAGIDDVLITFNLIGTAKAQHLARLLGMAKIAVTVDHPLAVATVAEAAALAQTDVRVLVEFESIKKRQGVISPDAALVLARQIESAPFLHFGGLMTYPSSPASSAWIARARDRFEREGIPIRTVSGGGTPTMHGMGTVEGLTEYRAGTSIYHDRKTVADGAATLDECALHVHATVVSSPFAGQVVLDTGSKSLTSDLATPLPGYGLLVEYPDAVIATLSEEHGAVDVTACAVAPTVGERVRIVPNHVCPVSNLFDEVVLHRGGRVEAFAPVAARGTVR